MKTIQDFTLYSVEEATEANIRGGAYRSRRQVFARPEAGTFVKRQVRVYEEGSLVNGLPISYPLYTPTDPGTPPQLP
ncbi:MAG: hypothetical protein JNN12_15205 [Bacteroidetes Order II. Incertae sedis bacterium]|nr:hypothetical protein [Bacteroidetes Order II. bacterium]